MSYFKDFRFRSEATFQEILWLTVAFCALMASVGLGAVAARNLSDRFIGFALGLLTAGVWAALKKFRAAIPPPSEPDEAVSDD